MVCEANRAQDYASESEQRSADTSEVLETIKGHKNGKVPVPNGLQQRVLRRLRKCAITSLEVV